MLEERLNYLSISFLGNITRLSSQNEAIKEHEGKKKKKKSRGASIIDLYQTIKIQCYFSEVFGFDAISLHIQINVLIQT